MTVTWVVDFEIEVGVSEKHRVGFHWNQFWGVVRIDVDSIQVLRKLSFIARQASRRYEVSVGSSEVHKVVVERTKTPLYGSLEQQAFRVFVDDRFVGDYPEKP
jgi:hypothetical protein